MAVTQRCERKTPICSRRRAPDQASARKPSSTPSALSKPSSSPAAHPHELCLCSSSAGIGAELPCAARSRVRPTNQCACLPPSTCRSCHPRRSSATHSTSMLRDPAAVRLIEAGSFNVPTWHLVSRGLCLRGLWGWVEAKVKRFLELWDGGVSFKGVTPCRILLCGWTLASAETDFETRPVTEYS